MRSFLCLLVLFSFSACDTPSPAFTGVEVSRHDIGGNLYAVYVKGARAQAIRTNFAQSPDIRAISRQAEMAIEQAAQCSVSEIFGDVAVLNAILDCSIPMVANQWAKWAKPTRRHLRCHGDSRHYRWGIGLDVSLECR